MAPLFADVSSHSCRASSAQIEEEKFFFFGWISIVFCPIHFCVSFGVSFLRLLPFFFRLHIFGIRLFILTWNTILSLKSFYLTVYCCDLTDYISLVLRSICLEQCWVLLSSSFPRWQLFVAFLFIYFLLQTRCVPQFFFIVPIWANLDLCKDRNTDCLHSSYFICPKKWKGRNQNPSNTLHFMMIFLTHNKWHSLLLNVICIQSLAWMPSLFFIMRPKSSIFLFFFFFFLFSQIFARHVEKEEAKWKKERKNL